MKTNITACTLATGLWLLAAPSATAFFDSHIGRWASRDPMNVEPPSLYGYSNNDPLGSVDVLGLWNEDVHKGKTAEWAITLKITRLGADTIGEWDNKVDTDMSPIVFTDVNWAWHFDRSAGGEDSRLKISRQMFDLAKAACSWDAKQRRDDDWYAAATSLGRALHPLQDWVAHGDLNRKAEAPNITSVGAAAKLEYAHNYWSKETRGLKGVALVDDPAFDAQGPDGRATIATLILALKHPLTDDRLYWAKFHPVGKRQRITLTELKTSQLLRQFQEHVKKNAKPCGFCRMIFLPPETK